MNILKSDCCNSLVVNEYDANTRSYFEDNFCFNCKQIGVKTDSDFGGANLNLAFLPAYIYSERFGF